MSERCFIVPPRRLRARAANIGCGKTGKFPGLTA
jgi:hypothetical protein